MLTPQATHHRRSPDSLDSKQSIGKISNKQLIMWGVGGRWCGTPNSQVGGGGDPDISLREFKPTEILREDFAFYSLSKYGS